MHLDLDTFFVSCERIVNPQLNNRPLIIGGTAGRGVVASCSYEARMFGVRSAMPMGLALRLCPHAKVIKGDMELYSNYSKTVTQIIEERAPVMEKASIDEFYIDVSGMDKFFGCYKWTDELTQYIYKETQLPMSFALSANKTVSKIGTGEAKPLGRLEIPPDKVKSFLDPLSVKKIPMVGEKTFQTLSRIGIRQIHTLAEMPIDVLQKMFGENGRVLWKKANGIDETPVEQYEERKSISSEQTFDQDTIDIPKLKSLLVAMVEKLAYQLRKEGWLASIIAVKIRYANFDTHTQQCSVPYTACDHKIIIKVHELFDKLFERRMRLRLIGIRFSGLVRGSYQIDLFESQERINLYQAIDKMRRRFGYNSVMLCAGMNLK